MSSIESSHKPDQRPTIKTASLILRPSTLGDVDRISQILGDRATSDTAMHIPHPFDPAITREWISKHPKKYQDGISVDFYIDQKSSGLLIGALHIDLNAENKHAELGFYIDQAQWNKGYGTELVTAATRFCFEELDLARVFAWCLCRNTASKRILSKAGFKPEGILRQHVMKLGKLEDIQYFGLLRGEYKVSEY